MHALVSYDPTPTFDPTNPNQRRRELWDAGNMAWTSYYWNRNPNAGSLQGLGSWSSIPSWAQTGIVIAASAAVGFFAWKKVGDSHIRPTLKKIPVVGGLMGARRARRRR
jgi:hypothetical protein